MTWKRIPHQFVLVLTFVVIGVGLAATIVQSTTAALRQADETVRYATAELQGVRYLARAHVALHELLAFRDLLVRATRPGGQRAAFFATAAAIAAIGDRSAAAASLQAAIAPQLEDAHKSWLSAASRRPISPQAVSAVIAAIQPLLTHIYGESGLSNDPSIDGINFGDAIVRFPVSLAYGSEAASIAAVNLKVGNDTLGQRFSAARLLARAETAVEVGRQDAEDEAAANPVAAVRLLTVAAANVRDFETLKNRVTATYVETGAPPRPALAVRLLVPDLDAFTVSSFAVIDALRDDLLGVVSARIAEGKEQHWHLLAATAAGVCADLLLMAALAWISIVSYQNGRKRIAAERAALESARAGLEVQLTHAKAQQALLRAKAQFRAVFDRAPTGMIIVDRECKIHDTNEAAAAMLQDDAEPVSALDVIADHAAAIEQIFAGTCELYSQENSYPGQADHLRWFHVSISPVRDEAGATLVAILMIRDITQSKSMEAQLVYEAGHDELTGLPNRKCFLAMLQRTLDDRKQRKTAGVFSVVFIDFNDFKTINDSFGHQAGDRFLIDGAARLRDSVRSTDIVARIGGDEFAIILHATDRAEIEKSVVRLQSVVSVPLNIEGQLVVSSASFGIAQAESSYIFAAEIIRDADTAMYKAKAQGGRNYVVFDASMREQVVRRMQLSIDIVHALEHHEMELFYQPIVDLETGMIAGCEALVRWRRADGALVSPGEFLPLAEENGSIIEIGRWVTTTACEQMREWNELAALGRLPGLNLDFVIHVNLAVPEVHHVDLLSNLRAILIATNVSRDQIILEITEGIVLKNTVNTRSTLDGLTGDGFRLCIDDFGTGYSSLRYLNELPLHSFKIDRSFVSTDDNAELANVSIVEMLMVLSRSIGLGVVAEGIESVRQWETLCELGCRYGQGFLFAPALPASRLTELLERNAALHARQPFALNADRD